MNVLDQSVSEDFALYHGDCAEVLAGLPEASVHLTCTSIPFASLYTYSNSPRDLGNCRTHSVFWEHFEFLVPKLLSATVPGRLAAVHVMNLPTSKARDGFIGITDFRGDTIRAFTAGGWIYHSEICIWKDPVTAMQRTKALGLLWKQLKKDSAMSRQGIPDYVLVFRKPGVNPEPVAHTEHEFPVQLWQQYASPVWMDINPSRTLSGIEAREEQDERHVCALQLDVIERVLKLWSNPGDRVLDPFAGIGSTGYVALQEGRRFVGVELKESYYQQAVKNLRSVGATTKAQHNLFERATG